MTVGQRIKFYRKEKGYTQSELGEMIGVSMQAVSKWETNSGMPDVSQVVPLCKALNVSADKLLGLGDDDEVGEVLELREKIGKHTVGFPVEEARRIYNLATPVFAKHPTNSEVAFWCLESFSVLISNDQTGNSDRQALLKECRRYESCITRYETNSDMLFKSYYVLSRCYNMLSDEERAEEIKKKIPYVFGDRTYWEAEFAFADGDMETALKKCKQSFADKARFISRCIRLARMISEKNDKSGGDEYRLRLNEYMLRIIDAFLSGGDFLPYRLMYQKMSLLSMMVCQCSELGMKENAENYLKYLSETRDEYFDFLKNKDNALCLMFCEEDMDGLNHVTKEKVNEYYILAEKAFRKHFC